MEDYTISIEHEDSDDFENFHEDSMENVLKSIEKFSMNELDIFCFETP